MVFIYIQYCVMNNIVCYNDIIMCVSLPVPNLHHSLLPVPLLHLEAARPLWQAHHVPCALLCLHLLCLQTLISVQRVVHASAEYTRKP